MSGPAENPAVPEQLVSPEVDAVREPFVVIRQEVELEVDFREKSVHGVAHIWIFTILPPEKVGDIRLDARQCEIDVESITVDGLKTTASYCDPYGCLKVPKEWQLGATHHHVMRKRMDPVFPKCRAELSVRAREKNPGCIPNDRALKISLRPEGLFNEPRRPLKIKTSRVGGDKAGDRPDPTDEIGVKISIPFRSNTLRDGLHFVGVEQGDRRYPHVYTRHSNEPGTASCIFPCVDDPRSRNPWEISIKCPRALGDVLEQRLATQSGSIGTVNGVRKRNGDGQPASHALLAEEDKLMEMTVVCSGVLISEQIDPKDERKKIMTFECKTAAAQHIGFAVGPFEHVDLWHEFRTEEADERLGANAAKIHGYCLPGRVDEVRHTCSPIVQASDHFALEFGKFPFDSYKICFLEDMVPDTVAVNSLSLCSTRLLYPEDTIDMEIEVTRKLVYSLASQYLGVHIIPDARSDSWIVVGMAWFITGLFMKMICGVNWYKFHIKTQSDKLVELDVNRPSLHELGKYLHVGEFEMDFMELKAPLVLYILDQRMSKYAGCAGIARVISQMVSAANISHLDAKLTSISLEEFSKQCEKKSHYRPGRFWHEWIHGAGCPRLAIKQKFNKKNLNVDLQIAQNQKGVKPPIINKNAFWREYQEELHEVYAGEVTRFFSGPFTVRIHEADGTPYEHYLDIKEDDKDGVAWSIPYNTKYKRLKRSKKKDGGAAAAATLANKQDIPEDDVVYFNMLGDVLQSDPEKVSWGLNEWEKNVQDSMDQESYEWIRFDCNFEWLCQIVTDMPGYMYLAQLQQDRDVVAHQDAMLFFTRANRHNMSSTIEVRTLVDKRYYHGIRTMAASDLPKQCTEDLNFWGLAHLILAFRHFFCYRVVGRSGAETFPPAPNDFSDKAQYAVQCAIVAAIARTRIKGRCSSNARNFLLDLIRFNDNSSNEYSDHFYVAKLLEALTTAIIPENSVSMGTLYDLLNMDDDEDLEFKQFIGKTVETIERFRRMDEWTSTYHNIWTTTALDCKMRLMKAKVIPMAPLDFLQYCQDENLDLVRIKAYECLVELGMIAKTPILKLLLNAMSADKSPFVRHRLFKAFCRGIAAIGLGEHQVAPAAPAPPPTAAAKATANVDADADADADADGPDRLEVEDDNGGLVIEQGEAEINQRKLDAKRKEDIGHTLAALKEELKGNADLQIGIWKAFESDIITLAEKRNLLELCAAMFEPEDSLLLTFKYPKCWKCTRAPKETPNGKNNAFNVPEKGPHSKKRSCIVVFTSYYRTIPRFQRLLNPPHPEAVEEKPPAPQPPQLPKKIKLSSKPFFSGPSPSNPGIPGTPGTPGMAAAPVRQGSISLTGPRTPLPPLTPAASVETPVVAKAAGAAPVDSIAVQPVARISTLLAASPPPIPAAPSPQPNGQISKEKTKLNKKRFGEERPGSEPPAKKAKSSTKNGRPSKVVTLKFKRWSSLKPDTFAKIKSEREAAAAGASTIVATPAGRIPAASPAPSAANSAYSPKAADSPGSLGMATPGSGYQSSGLGLGSAKQRKPLPSSASHGPAASPNPVNGARISAPAAVPGAQPKKLIKLKIKSSLSQPSAQPPPSR